MTEPKTLYAPKFLCTIVDKDGKVLRQEMRPVACGDDVCWWCGECLACYGCDPCFDVEGVEGEHRWVVEEV